MSGPDRNVRAGQIWRHYKGHAYFIMAVAQHSETLEEMVVYRQTGAKSVWVRPLDVFLSEKPDEPGVCTD
jgi:cyclomaltodextrinase